MAVTPHGLSNPGISAMAMVARGDHGRGRGVTVATMSAWDRGHHGGNMTTVMMGTRRRWRGSLQVTMAVTMVRHGRGRGRGGGVMMMPVMDRGRRRVTRAEYNGSDRDRDDED